MTPRQILRGLAALAMLAAALPVQTAAQSIDLSLYYAQAIVSGTVKETRRLGMAQCLEDVLVKVSGDPRLIADRRAKALAVQAESLVREIHYRDRMGHKPINDEQGTRDRPYDLMVTFEPAKIDAALQSLGRKPWTGARPRVAMFLVVNNGIVTYLLAADGERGADQRDALAAAGKQVAVPLLVPNKAAWAVTGLDERTLPGAEMTKFEAATRSSGADVALAGRLLWSDAARGWIAEWRMASGGKTYAWGIKGVSFDDAFRHAMRGAAQILSGNGQPK